MGKETEIKLRASQATLQTLRDHPLLKKRNKSGWQRVELFNQYYDTAARDLAHARVALRVRRDGEQFIQTLKSRGNSVAGLSERNEWDWMLSSAELDLTLLDDSCWPASLANLDKRQLQPIFRTDFVREKAEIAWGRGKTRVVIEAALDQGQVIAGSQSEAISELELELRQGEPAALLELAVELAASLPLMPCDISKAERGYRLFDADSYDNLPTLPSLSAECSLDQAFAELAWHLLGSSQRLAEQYRHSGHWRQLQHWLQQLIDLRALLASLGQAAPRSSSRMLREGLDALLADWRPRLQAGGEDEQVRQQAVAQFAAELQNTRWGLLSLQLSQWLWLRAWTVNRTARGTRQGQAALASWLPRLLSEEAGELRLPRYLHEPAALAEQLPRLDRLCAWLRLARGTLPLEESDRLYGELHKLQQLAAQSNADNEQRRLQAQTVAGLKAWKQLIR